MSSERPADTQDLGLRTQDSDLAGYCAEPPAGAWPAGWRVHYEAETASTQDRARAAATAGAPHGSVFVADWQRAGRGRRGRVWEAPPGTSLLFSILVRDCALSPFAQTAVCTLALCRTVEALGLAPRIKWPNDLLLADRKVAGVLTERASGAGGPFQIVGIGLNARFADAAATLPPTATALDLALGQPVARGPLLARLLHALAPLLAQPALAWATRLHDEWGARLWRYQETVQIGLETGPLSGRLEGVGVDGTLLLRLADGRLQRITTGDVLL